MNRMTEIPNFRDIGSKKIGDTDKLKKHVLFRSGSLSKLSEKDQLFLTDDCQLKTIVDFRSDQEKNAEPDVVLTGVNYVPINVLESVTENASLESMMTTTSSAQEMMESVYENLVTAKSAKKGYQLFLELLLEGQGQPLLFHCSAGKDRTGFAAALLLTLLGASKTDIYADYLLTNQQRSAVNQQMIDQIKATYHLSETQLKQLNLMLQVDQAYLDKAFETIDQEFGNFDHYVTEGLNFSHEKITDLRNFYLISD